MSRAQLAERLGITRSSVVKLEEREASGWVTLDALSKAANALGCTVVYAIVPATGSLEELVAARARLVAQALASRAGHSMSLEDQASDSDETLHQQRVVERRLLAEWPRDLWDTSWDARSNDARADHG
jgi:predicted DNA-binding mobile mystery protein A